MKKPVNLIITFGVHKEMLEKQWKRTAELKAKSSLSDNEDHVLMCHLSKWLSSQREFTYLQSLPTGIVLQSPGHQRWYSICLDFIYDSRTHKEFA